MTARARLAVFLAWAGAVGTLAARHEPWRDEVRAFTIATSTSGVGELLRVLHDEGHPALWYLLLRGLHALVPIPAVLPAASLLVAAAAVALFLLRSPLPSVLLVLFPFSVLPLYEYSVMARPYGLALLLGFAFAALYRPRRRALLAACLVLLPNTGAHAAFVAAALALVWCADEVRDAARTIPRVLLPVGSLAAGTLLAAWTALPRDEVTVHRGMPSAAGFFGAFLAPGGSVLLSPFPAPAALDVAILLLFAAGFAARPSRLVAIAGAVLGLHAFFYAVYPGDLRHVGLALVLVLTLLWIEVEGPPLVRTPGPAAPALRSAAFGAVLPVVLALGVLQGAAKARTDFKEEMSASRALGAFLRASPGLSGAILTGEPDYALEPLPYYVPNPIFLPRERRFARWVTFTRANRDTLSLGELLDEAERLKRETGRRVVVLLQPLFVDPGPKDSFTHSFGKTFTRTAAELERLERETGPLGRFVDTPRVDERYAVYEVRGAERSARPAP